MDAGTWLGIEAGSDEQQRRLPLEPRLCTPAGQLFGGAALGAAIAVAESVTGRSTLYAHIQLLRAARGPGVLELEVTEHGRGRSVTHAAVRATLDGRSVAHTQLALSDPQGPGPSDSWASAPSVPPPEACPERSYRDPAPTSINGTLDVRLARGRAPEQLAGRSPDGRCALWARVRGQPLQTSGTLLALFADHIPFGARQALGKEIDVLSLDGELRLASTEPREPGWVLLETSITHVAGQLGHGCIQLWAPDGAPLASGAQTFRILEPTA